MRKKTNGREEKQPTGEYNMSDWVTIDEERYAGAREQERERERENEKK